MPQTVGVALGGGGAKGLSHIPLLEVLDELAIKPVIISGTSIGAFIGTMYAAGVQASTIRDFFYEVLKEPKSLSDLFDGNLDVGWFDYVELDIGRNSLLTVDKLLDELVSRFDVTTFEELPIPLKLIASDFWNREEIVLDSGQIQPALAASLALPGLFKPVQHGGRVLIDGGVVNPVPWDHLIGLCDVSIAIDVIGVRSRNPDPMPSLWELLFNTIQIAEKSVLREKMKLNPPSIYLDVEIEGIQVLEFDKADEIYKQVEPFKDKLRTQLESVLELD